LVADAYLVEYPLTALRQHKPAAVAFSPPADESELETAPRGGEWEVHHGLELVIEELVRQIDMWRHAVRDGSVVVTPTSRQAKAAKKGGAGKDKKVSPHVKHNTTRAHTRPNPGMRI
jgi:hypothetical protein